MRAALDDALAEREHGGLPVEVHTTRSSFLGGQESAVLELLEGRDNLPVTSWAPAAVAGLRGRPTLVSNAETFAQVAAVLALGPAGYAELGTPAEPGTTLLTVAGDGPHGAVIEAPYGVGLGEVLQFCGYDPASAVLLGGYHGTWVPAGTASSLPVSREQLAARASASVPGVVLPLDARTCPVVVTAGVTGYLARGRRRALRALPQRPARARRGRRGPRRRRRPGRDPAHRGAHGAAPRDAARARTPTAPRGSSRRCSGRSRPRCARTSSAPARSTDERAGPRRQVRTRCQVPATTPAAVAATATSSP